MRRLELGEFSIEDAFSIEQLNEMDEQSLSACLMNVDKPLDFLPAVALSSEQAVLISHGQSVSIQEELTGAVRIYHAMTFLGLGEMLLDGKLVPKKMFNMNIEAQGKTNGS